jgi:FKBP-type peptidyl-prolyl cis-trans isomerase FkpA
MRARTPTVLLFAATLAVLSACRDPGPPPGGAVAELQRIEQREGTGALATPGSEVTVHYTGWLYDEREPDRRGAKFDSSLDRGQPLTFLLGAGRVIRGWDEGVAGMRVGGRRTLLIPSGLAYGRRGAGDAIPPHASLVFEVELLDVKLPD